MPREEGLPVKLHSAIRVAVATLGIVALPATATGRGAGAVYTRATFPYGERVNQPLTLPGTMFRLDLPLAANLSSGQAGEPVSIPAAVDLGITDDLQIGLFHGTGICLSGSSNGCPEVYDDAGLRAVVGIARGLEWQLAAEAILYASSLSDGRYVAGGSAAYKRSVGNFGLTLDAGLLVAVTERSAAPVRQLLFASAEGAVQFGDSLAAFATIGLDRPIDTAAGVPDRFGVPVGFGVELEPANKITVSAELLFPNLLGEDGTGDEREGRLVLRLYI